MCPKGILRIKLEKPAKLESIYFLVIVRLMPKGALNNITGFVLLQRNLFFFIHNVASMTRLLSFYPSFSLKGGEFQQIQ